MHDPEQAFKLTRDRAPDHSKIADGLPEVIVNPALCTNPKDCLLCFRSCSSKLFAYDPGTADPQTRADQLPRVLCHMPELCTLCMQCVEVCPQKAITIKTTE